MSLTLHRALLVLVAAALLAGIVPLGVVLHQWVGRELEARARDEVAAAPAALAAQNDALADALMMAAKDMAGTRGLAEALARGQGAEARRVLAQAAAPVGDEAVLVDASGTVREGPRPPEELVSATRRGEMPVRLVCDGDTLRFFALAPVADGEGAWLGAAGTTYLLDAAAAARLAGVAGSDLVLVGKGGSLVSTLADREEARAIARVARPGGAPVQEIRTDGRRYLASTTHLGDATVLFLRDLERELALLPRLRAAVGWSAAASLALALALGAVLASALARPVRALSDAADRVTRGDFQAPLPRSPVREVQRTSAAFDAMRRALAARLAELQAANHELAERQTRLTALQSELIQRERAALSGRLVAELAHEIRNPVAALRNCLELLRRRLDGDAAGREFADLAIDELLRMHELAERMLDLNRPGDPAAASCDASAVARDVAALFGLGRGHGEMAVWVDEDGPAPAAVPPDALKQVLLNLAQNARDAVPESLELEIAVREEGDRVVLEVRDNGPGVPPAVRERIFDPFFTTKGVSGGIGLGLFVADATLRRYGGAIRLCDARPGEGACFRLDLPRAPASVAAEAP